MNKLRGLLSHLTMILALMLMTFLVLDQFNPLMNFTDHPISHVLLAILCISGIALHVMYCAAAGRNRGKEK